MKKTVAILCLLAITLSACNFPSQQGNLPSLEQQAATVVAQTLTASAMENPVPLASPTAKSTEKVPLASPTSPTEAPTIQPNASASPTSGTGTPTATYLTVDSNTNCREGPGQSYSIVIILVPGTTYQMIGRTADNKYWVVTEIGKANSCWVPAEMSNAFGNVNLLSVTTPSAPTSAAGALQPPTSLRYEYSCVYNGVNSDITVKLSWKDQSNDEDGFRVYRDGVLVATMDANTTFYSEVFAGAASFLYSYRVSSFNTTGEAMGDTITFSCSG
jgi:hypothetical protein